MSQEENVCVIILNGDQGRSVWKECSPSLHQSWSTVWSDLGQWTRHWPLVKVIGPQGRVRHDQTGPGSSENQRQKKNLCARWSIQEMNSQKSGFWSHFRGPIYIHSEIWTNKRTLDWDPRWSCSLEGIWILLNGEIKGRRNIRLKCRVWFWQKYNIDPKALAPSTWWWSLYGGQKMKGSLSQKHVVRSYLFMYVANWAHANISLYHAHTFLHWARTPDLNLNSTSWPTTTEAFK